MFKRISNSWELLKASARVLSSDKKLIVFPLVSMIGVIIVTITFAVPLLMSGVLDRLVSSSRDTNSNSVGIFSFVIGLLFYLVMYTVIYFANSALVGAVMMRFRGEEPTLSDGFRIAWQHIGSILGYALISATVGMILRWIAEKGIIGRIVASLTGFAWNVSTYLVVPILVIEGVSPVDAIKRSVTLLKQTWGEQIVGNLSIGTAFGLIWFVLTLASLLLLSALSSALNSAAIMVGGIALIVVLTIVAGLISSALNSIYVVAVYQYAVAGNTGGFFDEALVQEAFRSKKKR
ncbi:MAG: DUF6159 family protein [Chloroflexota bacterium]